MLVAAKLSISSDKYAANFTTLFGLWTMRPRLALGVMTLPTLLKVDKFDYTRTDLIFSEGILCVLSAIFAVTFVNQPTPQEGCLPPFYSLHGPHHVRNAFYVTVVTGFIGLCVLARLILVYIKNKGRRLLEIDQDMFC